MATKYKPCPGSKIRSKGRGRGLGFGGPYKLKKPKYYTFDMAKRIKYFRTKKDANIYRKKVHDRLALWLKLYKT